MDSRHQIVTLNSCAKVLGENPERLCRIGEGANGLIVTDGSGIAYKFPKNEIALQGLKREISAAGQLAKTLSVAVPEYLESHLEHPIGEAFCCYRLLRGVSLTPQIYAEHRQRLAGQLSVLLREIHTTHLSQVCGEPMDFESLYQEIQQYLFAQMDKEEQRQISRRFEEYLSRTKQGERCTVHGDLGAANILCDPEKGEITAVIDWAELSKDDPAIDYSSLTCQRSLPACREDLLRLDPGRKDILERMDFIQFTFPLQDLLYQAKVKETSRTKEKQ